MRQYLSDIPEFTCDIRKCIHRYADVSGTNKLIADVRTTKDGVEFRIQQKQ